ncbi:hypothetical protein [Sphingobacterium sp. ML3W]|nr:hypothetical protein [Sphingobacterium sp. ML3W]
MKAIIQIIWGKTILCPINFNLPQGKKFIHFENEVQLKEFSSKHNIKLLN